VDGLWMVAVCVLSHNPRGEAQRRNVCEIVTTRTMQSDPLYPLSCS